MSHMRRCVTKNGMIISNPKKLREKRVYNSGNMTLNDRLLFITSAQVYANVANHCQSMIKHQHQIINTSQKKLVQSLFNEPSTCR